MSRPGSSLEFDASITGRGVIVVPAPVREALGADATGTLRVLITPRVIAEKLRRIGVTETEIEQIAARQLEPREHVIQFLLAEGALTAARRRRRKRS